MDLNGFNAAEVEPNEPRDPLPAGWYKCVITESEEKPTKAQTGSYLQMTLEVIEGDHQGRKVFERLNLNNPNQTAVEIAQRTLSGICRSVGVMTPRNSSDLHDKPLMVKVAVKPASGDYGASNEIKEYAEPEKKAAAPASGGGAATPPWKRK
jgi:hypothetical protein